jgi:hypothetical protein
MEPWRPSGVDRDRRHAKARRSIGIRQQIASIAAAREIAVDGIAAIDLTAAAAGFG